MKNKHIQKNMYKDYLLAIKVIKFHIYNKYYLIGKLLYKLQKFCYLKLW